VTYCEQCGSTSFDVQGFCRGCGAHSNASAPHQATSESPIASALNEFSAAPTPASRFSFWDLITEPGIKQPWVAVLLALLFGPIGMIYCTYLGAAVMFVAEILAVFFLPKFFMWFVMPVVCAVWAGLAARSANSIY
jgi:hypothetical protein